MNKSVKQILTCLLVFAATYLYAQDEIIMTSGDILKSKIVEVGVSEVKYKKWENQEGPVYTAPKSQIFMIKYENGTKDVFGKTEAPINSGQPAVLYFYRPKKFAGSGPEIIVGTITPDEVIVKLHNGHWHKKEYTNFGERQFVTGVFAINPESFNYVIEPGKTYYIRCTLYSKGFKQMAELALVDEAVARNEMNDLKEQRKPK